MSMIVKTIFMKEYKYFFGVDISKKTIDVTLSKDSQLTHRQFSNDTPGMEDLMEWLKELNLNFDSVLFCMEATGLYCFPLTQFLAGNAIDIWVEHATQIKKANALDRGKNDKVDSRRIAIYATKNLDRLRLWRPMSTTLEKIKHLASLRERLVETKKRLETPIKEFEEVGNVTIAKLLTKTIKNSLAAIDKDLKNVEEKIVEIVNGDENLKQLYKLITSVVGIGFVTAINLLIFLRLLEFSKKKTPVLSVVRGH
jgi:transposase